MDCLFIQAGTILHSCYSTVILYDYELVVWSSLNPCFYFILCVCVCVMASSGMAHVVQTIMKDRLNCSGSSKGLEGKWLWVTFWYIWEVRQGWPRVTWEGSGRDVNFSHYWNIFGLANFKFSCDYRAKQAWNSNARVSCAGRVRASHWASQQDIIYERSAHAT